MFTLKGSALGLVIFAAGTAVYLMYRGYWLGFGVAIDPAGLGYWTWRQPLWWILLVLALALGSYVLRVRR
jgi:hypothetical protein